MPDAFTGTKQFGTARSTQEEAPRKQINGFTGEEEDAAPLSIGPSPMEQRLAAMFPKTTEE